MSSKYDFAFVGAWREDFEAFQDQELKQKVEKAYNDLVSFIKGKRGIKRFVVKVDHKSRQYSVYYEKV